MRLNPFIVRETPRRPEISNFVHVPAILLPRKNVPSSQSQVLSCKNIDSSVYKTRLSLYKSNFIGSQASDPPCERSPLRLFKLRLSQPLIAHHGRRKKTRADDRARGSATEWFFRRTTTISSNAVHTLLLGHKPPILPDPCILRKQYSHDLSLIHI